MCDNVCIEVNETVENISIEVRDFSVLNIISGDANNSATVGSDGLLFVPENAGGGTVTSVNGILPDVGGNVVVPIPTVPDFADQTEVNNGLVTDKTIAPNTLAGWWTHIKTLAQTFIERITFGQEIKLTPIAEPTYERGLVYFDDVNDCISFMDSISGTSVQVGYEVLMRARNNTGTTIQNGSVVYISGAIGQNSTVALAQSNTLPTSEIIGIATHNIANNTVGKICVFGNVRNVDASMFSDGDILYLSPTVAGGLTNVIPSSPNYVVSVGVVEHSHPTQGKILVKPQRALANNNSLGAAQNVAPTQNAVKTALDLKLSNDPTDYTTATTPLDPTDKAIVFQGGVPKEVAVSEFGGGGTAKKSDNLFFQDAVGSTVKTITADQKNLHQSRFLANASPFGVLGLTFGNGVTETGGVVNLSYFSDVCVSQITGDYIGKVKKVNFTYARNVAESVSNTNVVIRVMAESKYNTDMQLICEHNLVSTTLPAFAESKVEIPILTHLDLSPFSNIKWCIRSNNATAQQFGIIRLNVITEEL